MQRRRHLAALGLAAAAGAAAAVALVLTRAEDSADRAEPKKNAVDQRLVLPGEETPVNGVFTVIAADGDRAIPLLLQPKSCGLAIAWDVGAGTRTPIQPWARCGIVYRRIVKLAAGWDSYGFAGAIARRLIVLTAEWHVSDSCAVFLNRVVFPARTGEPLGRYDSGCLFVGEFADDEKSVGNFASAGGAVYFNLYAARPGQTRWVTMQKPAVLALGRHGPPHPFRGLHGVLEDTAGGRAVLRTGRKLRVVPLRGPGAMSLVFPAGSKTALTRDQLVVQVRDHAVVYDVSTGRRVVVRPLRRDPFRAPEDPDFGRTPTPLPELLDADEDLVVYASGRRLRLLRLRDAFDAIVAEGSFNDGSLEFPFFTARFTAAGLFYGISERPRLESAAGTGRLVFVPRDQLRAALP
jgi:hypothetical protein